MWGGDEAVENDNPANVSKHEYWLGLSTFLNLTYDEDFDEYFRKKKFFSDKLDFLCENSKLWKKLIPKKILEEGAKSFDWSNSPCVAYSGYLLNHTQKLAVSLSDYYERSKSIDREGNEFVIDVIPVLTETGGGSIMALFDGMSADSTEEHIGKWCADLLEIRDELPENYELVTCCFAGIWSRTRYCYRTFGFNEDNFILCNNAGKLLEVVGLSLFGFKRGTPVYVKIEKTEKGIRFFTDGKED